MNEFYSQDWTRPHRVLQEVLTLIVNYLDRSNYDFPNPSDPWGLEMLVVPVPLIVVEVGNVRWGLKSINFYKKLIFPKFYFISS